MSDAGSEDEAAQRAFLRILAQHPELTIDDLAELRSRHGAGFGAITVAQIRSVKPRKRDRPNRGPKLRRASSESSGLPIRPVLRLLQSSDGWLEAETVAETLGLELLDVQAAIAELVQGNRLQTGFDGQWKYRG